MDQLAQLERFREGVLAGAKVGAGETVLDVGCGDGLIGFGALELVGDEGRVVFSDVSEELLDVCRARADGDERCRFVHAAAEDLSAVGDRSVDVVTTRSVVIYVVDKQRAFDEFFRVLRPGGRLSMFEPINSFGYPEPDSVFAGCDVSPVEELAAKLRDVTRRLREEEAMLGFDERDLIAFADRAGFGEVSLRLEIEVKPEPYWLTRDWDVFVNASPNPLAPTLAEAMAEALTPEEAERFTAHLRPLVERGEGSQRLASAWLRAVKT